MSQASNQAASDRASRLGKLLADVACRRQAGEAVDDAALIAAHPDLMPELAEQLRALGLVQGALARGAQDSSTAPERDEFETITLASSTEAAASAANITIPRTVGSVRLIRPIGQGAMGVVWLGRDHMLQRQVAVKFLINTVSDPDDPEFVRFREGARAAAALRHPNLNTVHQADVINGVPFLVMEYVDGPTLAEVLAAHGKLRIPVAETLMLAICTAVSKLHKHGIVHRDIKPSNVLLDRDGRVCVTDFGLACRESAISTASRSEIAGTPHYMAPESFAGQASARTDVYALGILMFELLTAMRPFRGTSLAELQRSHAETALPVEPLREAGVEADLIEVIERATHKNALFRYRTAGQLLTALQAVDARTLGGPVGANDVSALLVDVEKARPAPTRSATTGTDSASYYDVLHTQAAQMVEKHTRDRTAQQTSENTSNRISGLSIGDDPNGNDRTLGSAGLGDESGGAEGSEPPFMARWRTVAIAANCIGLLVGLGGFIGMLAWGRGDAWILLILAGLAAFQLAKWSNAKWLARLRYRLWIRTFPELARFSTDEMRTRAWREALDSPERQRILSCFACAIIVLIFVGIAFAPQAMSWTSKPFLLTTLRWLAPLLLAPVAAVLVARQLRRQLRSQLANLGVPVCIPCGYDLRGQTVPRCPECGAPARAPGMTVKPSALQHPFLSLIKIPVVLAACVAGLVWLGMANQRLDGALSAARTRGTSLRARGDQSGAVEEYRRAIRECQRKWWLHGSAAQLADLQLDLGQTLAQLRRFDEAEQCLLEARRGLVPKPEDAWGYMSPTRRILHSTYAALAKLYEDWNLAEPGKGHDQQAARLSVDEYARIRQSFRGDYGVVSVWFRDLGESFQKSAQFADAERCLLRATEAYETTQASLADSNYSRLCYRFSELYSAWHKAEPNAGYDVKAAEWRAKSDTTWNAWQNEKARNRNGLGSAPTEGGR